MHMAGHITPPVSHHHVCNIDGIGNCYGLDNCLAHGHNLCNYYHHGHIHLDSSWIFDFWTLSWIFYFYTLSWIYLRFFIFDIILDLSLVLYKICLRFCTLSWIFFQGNFFFIEIFMSKNFFVRKKLYGRKNC